MEVVKILKFVNVMKCRRLEDNKTPPIYMLTVSSDCSIQAGVPQAAANYQSIYEFTVTQSQPMI